MTQIWLVSGPQKIFSLMYTKEQLKELENKLDILDRYKNRLKALQNLKWLKVNICSVNSDEFSNVTLSTEVDNKIHNLLIESYISRIKALQDEVENTIIINPSKL